MNAPTDTTAPHADAALQRSVMRTAAKKIASLAAAPLLLASLLTAAHAVADEVVIPLGQQGEQVSIERPPRGTNKAQVEAVYGEPQSRRGPTGNPPIYAWEYPQYTVYFEGDHVLHTVIKHQKQDRPQAQTEEE